MSDRTPAERLNAAADLLERCGQAAVDHYTPPAWFSAEDLVANDLRPAEAAWIALVGPDIAPHLAAWLRVEAQAFRWEVRDESQRTRLHRHALAFADRILGGTE